MILDGILGQTGKWIGKNKKDKKIKESIEHYRIKNINDAHFKFKDMRNCNKNGVNNNCINNNKKLIEKNKILMVLNLRLLLNLYITKK